MRTVVFLLALLSFNIVPDGAKALEFHATCAACAVPTGLTASGLTSDTATLSWDAVGGASLYNIEIEDEQNNPSNYHVEATVSGTAFMAVSLQAGVKYKFKVRARCGGDKSDWSEWHFFSSSGGNSNGLCDTPAALSASAVGNGAYMLNWSKVGAALQYRIEIEDEQNSPSTYHVELTVADTFYELSGLQTGILYKYKVRNICSNGQSDWSSWLFFNGNSGGGIGTGPGDCQRPTGLNVSTSSATEAKLTWNAVPGIASFALEIEKESPGAPWKLNQVVMNANSFSVANLLPNTAYKFKVRSNCPSGGHSAWSKWKKFKTPNMSAQPNQEASTSEDRGVGTGETGLKLAIVPNPAIVSAQISVWSDVDSDATLRFLAVSGTLVKSLQIALKKGENTLNISLLELDPGIYFVQVQREGQTSTAKLLLLR